MTGNFCVVLLGGGLDSTTTLAIARSEGFECYAMSFRNGRRRMVELKCAREVAQRIKANAGAYPSAFSQNTKTYGHNQAAGTTKETSGGTMQWI
jgi:7-cyano-7-deazaguanine synthase in queuosine biosynthesis